MVPVAERVGPLCGRVVPVQEGGPPCRRVVPCVEGWSLYRMGPCQRQCVTWRGIDYCDARIDYCNAG